MINSIINANAYIQGVKLAGKLSELELPAVKIKTQEVTALGLYGSTEVPAGIEKMEAKFKFNAIYTDAWKYENPHKSCNLIIKSNMQVVSAAGVSENVPVVATISGLFKELPTGSIKPQERLEAEHLMTVNYYKLEVNKEVIWEIDVFNNIFKHCGEDLLSDFNTNQK
ncbi:phage major tail tube protein [uncultured Rikenella sp.]|uniref:phage major tail tube protein n=1 Tax=uncultured Rikenella sp. TaxID=368003 RepID=UPI002628FB6C|nr:phage major tail tube protein [uncultured Rikenella sp.]